ncbi:alpha-galactosidase [Mucilaginibacter sp. L196]|uniref:alpha-galactosidase n=1 Tax=Mucilaginibacter sp. L196 TaxID=1641870 RepID=UPI00131A6E30|nr:alpha-galactosidase [Mucilaginibacter sp. L196]
MNRKHFLYLGGTSLAGLLFVKQVNALTAVHQLVHLPQKVFVKLDDGIQELQSSDKQTWTYKDITVKLHYNHADLGASVHSPTMALHNVQLQWTYAVPSSSIVLGDHWERTYGDVHFQPALFSRKLPWYFVLHNGAATTCFGVKTGCNTICYWQVGDDKMQLTLDTTNGGSGVKLGDRVLHAADIIATKNKSDENTFATARRFCGMMCPNPRLPKQPVYGINDWYFAYGNSSYDLIIQHTTLLADLATDTNNKPFSVVDDGWSAYTNKEKNYRNDYSQPNDKFKDMHKLAGNINQLGMRAGLWTRPLSTKPDTYQKLLAPTIPGRDDVNLPTLDPTIDENLDYIKSNITLYKQWGYDLVKHDFSSYDIFGRWGATMADGLTVPGWQFNDNTKTNAEIILNLYRSIREAAGDMYLIGCNTMSHLSAGIFEMNRIGDDTSGNEWSRTRKMGVNTLGFRMVQHNKFYAVDGDCVGLTTKVPWDKNKQWMSLLAESSAPLFISAQPNALGAEQKQHIKHCFALAAKPQPIGEPLDWLTNQWPKKWKLDGKVKEFDWS